MIFVLGAIGDITEYGARLTGRVRRFGVIAYVNEPKLDNDV